MALHRILLMKHNISQFNNNCYGCGVCAIACPQKIIEIKENAKGFYGPVVSEPDRCTDCGLCLSVCAFNDTRVLPGTEHSEPNYYAAWSKDETIRRETSSGGIGFVLAKHLIEQGFKACGVRYNPEKNRAEHFIANTVENYLPSIGSKYIPSYTFDGFSKLNRKERFFVSGTPCQIDSLRRWIRKVRIEDHFILMDFFCHGVPSLTLWRKYLQYVGAGTINQVKWRDKTTGWHDSWTIKIINRNSSIYRSSLLRNNDLFYRFFLGNFCLGEACYHCKYKMASSAADIRIGDLWGDAYDKNQKGVSALLAITKKGKKLVETLDDCQLIQHPASVVLEGQMQTSASKPLIYPLINQMLKQEGKTLPLIFMYVKGYNFLKLPIRVLRKIKRVIKNGK